MATALLYHRDPNLLTFEAAVAAHGDWRGRESVILDETAFYPEAGGQLADRGTLAGVSIADVQVDDAGVVHHLLDGPLPEVGARVAGAVEKARRRQFTAQHTAQHMLSRALIDEAKAETVSAHLGESVCTVDVSVPALAESALARAEALANSVVDDDLAIRAFFPSEPELRALPLRRQPKVSENIRVIEIGAFDVSPCGGTHCLRTSQVGLIRVVGLERYKGMMRVSFQAGPRGRADVFARARTLEQLATAMSTSPEDVPAGLDKLRTDLKGARDEKKGLLDKLAQLRAQTLVAGGVTDPIVLVVDEGVEVMRALAERVVTLGGTALFSSPQGEGTQVLLARGAGSTIDCGALLKQLAATHGGKGGGKAERAEGRIGPITDWAATTRAALDVLGGR
jgi:alanyl-tRNA synthetase